MGVYNSTHADNGERPNALTQQVHSSQEHRQRDAPQARDHLPLSFEDRQDLFQSVENDLSPENLHCDGEISNAEANRMYNFLQAVQAQLEAS
jgi:hypothetical protein